MVVLLLVYELCEHPVGGLVNSFVISHIVQT